MQFDHVALSVKNVYESVAWYRDAFKAVVEYEDETWAMLSIGDIRIALTKSGHHPPHLAFKVNSINDFPDGCEVKQHRDGSWYFYDRDRDGNVIEWITYSKL
jgi:catechol 2,3-dioxygenase-like lactoylglutathione lyase family enzyme